MTDEVKLLFEKTVRHTLEQTFEPDVLNKAYTLEANTGPVYRAFILVYDEGYQPELPCMPEPTLKLRDNGDIFFVYLLAKPAIRPSESAEEASNRWGQYERCQKHFRRLTKPKKQPYSFPNPLRGYAEIIGGSNRTFYPGDLVMAYCEIAKYKKEHSVFKAGKARGAQRRREVEHTTIPSIERTILDLVEEGKKPTQKAVAEHSRFGIATIKRHWNHARLVEARSNS